MDEPYPVATDRNAGSEPANATRLLLSLVPVPLALLDRSGGLLWGNEAYLRARLPGTEGGDEDLQLEPEWSELARQADSSGTAACTLSGEGREWLGALRSSPEVIPGCSYLLSLFEVTERIEAEAEHQRHLRHEALARMASGLNHDFNNVLFILSGNLELAEIASAPANRASIERASESLDRAREFCRRLATLSRGGDPKLAPVNAEDWLERVCAKIATPSHPVVCSLSRPLPKVRIDEAQFETVFRALAENAREACGTSGSLLLRARMEFLPASSPVGIGPGNHLAIEFTDTGEGMCSDVTARAGEPYFTDKLGGRGLSLAEARSIILRHGGRLQVRSRKGFGTRVLVWLPIDCHAE